MEKILWKVEGMTCSNCALSVSKVLQKQGLQQVQVNAITGDVSFENIDAEKGLNTAKKNITDLGYHVVDDTVETVVKKKPFLSTYLQKFWFTLPFTLEIGRAHV